MTKETEIKKTSKNKNLHKASKSKNDEFYTRIEDIENELGHYEKHFKDKTIFCNCDDPRESNFFHYFTHNFEHLELKKLITTCYKNQNVNLFSQGESEKASYLEYNGDKNKNRVPDIEEIGIKHLKGDGDFRSPECIEMLKQADIVVTNPPFSLFREYIAQLVEYKKKFIIIGNQNAITYKDIFKLIKGNKIWLGYTSPKEFKQQDGSIKKFGNICWFTNLPHKKRNEELILYKEYNAKEYPKYDNYNAINVDKVKDIPMDYNGAMGVPITFLGKHNPNQSELLGIMNTGEENKGIRYEGTLHGRPIINGVEKYLRILIKNKKEYTSKNKLPNVWNNLPKNKTEFTNLPKNETIWTYKPKNK